jgi:hypothetical protein
MVYSTDPRLWFDADGVDYIVKGPDPNTVVAEAIGYRLARGVGIAVPEFALATQPEVEGHFFASQVLQSLRDASPWLRKPRGVEELASIVLFDVWVANVDRNHGGLLARRNDMGEMELVAIDFEKSQTLRGPYPIVTSGAVEPRRLWPTELGALLRGVPVPAAGLRAIQAVSDSLISTAVAEIAGIVGPSCDWADSTSQVLRQRRDRLADLAREVWQ